MTSGLSTMRLSAHATPAPNTSVKLVFSLETNVMKIQMQFSNIFPLSLKLHHTSIVTQSSVCAAYVLAFFFNSPFLII